MEINLFPLSLFKGICNLSERKMSSIKSSYVLYGEQLSRVIAKAQVSLFYQNMLFVIINPPSIDFPQILYKLFKYHIMISLMCAFQYRLYYFL